MNHTYYLVTYSLYIQKFNLIKTTMSNEDICTKEIESWNSYEYALRKEDREYFHKMLNDCYEYSDAINVKGGLLPTEPIIMALLLIQQKMIKKLLGMIESSRINENTNCLKNCDDRK